MITFDLVTLKGQCQGHSENLPVPFKSLPVYLVKQLSYATRFQGVLMSDFLILQMNCNWKPPKVTQQHSSDCPTFVNIMHAVKKSKLQQY